MTAISHFVRVLLDLQILHLVLLFGGNSSSSASQTRFNRSKWSITFRRLRCGAQSSSPNLIENLRRFWPDETSILVHDVCIERHRIR